MLPKINEQTKRTQNHTPHLMPFTNRSSALQHLSNVQNHSIKLIEEAELHNKLSFVYQTMRTEAGCQPKSFTERNGVYEVQKEINVQEKKLQQKTRILNILKAQNNKLKEQVNGERNQRVIYFNIYKNLEHEIHDWEEKYKDLLVERKASEVAIEKMQEKFEKVILKFGKQIEQKTFRSNKNIYQKENENAEMGKSLRKKENLMPTEKQLPNDKTEEKDKKGSFMFEVQQKKKYLQIIQNKIKIVTQSNSLVQGAEKYAKIEQLNDKTFEEIKKEQQRQRQISQKLNINDKNVDNLTENHDAPPQTPSSASKQLYEQLSKQIQELQRENILYEKKLSQFIDFDVRKLENENILRHTLRKRQLYQKDKRKLEKMLQQTEKQKNHYTQILTPSEMCFQVIRKGLQ